MDELQDRLARVALDVLAEYGFALAGGYALQAHQLVDRVSEDIDMFTNRWDVTGFNRRRCSLRGVSESRLGGANNPKGGDLCPPPGNGSSVARTATVDLAADFRRPDPVNLSVGPCSPNVMPSRRSARPDNLRSLGSARTPALGVRTGRALASTSDLIRFVSGADNPGFGDPGDMGTFLISSPLGGPMTVSLIDHLEQYLGLIQEGWTQDANGRSVPLQVALFNHGDRQETIAYSTIGLSNSRLTSPSKKEIRQELLIVVSRAVADPPIPGLLQQVGEHILSQRRPLLRGEVVRRTGNVIPETDKTALYAVPPVYFPDEFGTVQSVLGPIVLVWLVPITAVEVGIISALGWREFEKRLERSDPDLTDPYRPSIK